MNINTRNMNFVNYNGQEMEWVKYNGVTVYEAWKTLIAQGVPPLTLLNCKGVDLVYYKIYGNSIQDGTPSPENPIEIKSVGDLLLPEEYQQLDYIRNNGTQVIDTGIYPTSNTDVHIKFMPSDNSSTEYLMGSRSTAIFYSVVKTRANSYYTTVFGVNASVNFTDINSVVGDLYEFDSISNGDGTFTSTLKDLTQNISQTGSATIGNLTSSPTLKIFGYSTQYIHPSVRVYEFKIWQNKELVMDMIPCYRKSDNVVGMYDLVSKTFFSNARTGNFIKGNDKNQYIIPVIVSDGTNSTTTNIYLNEPLRKIGDYADYIDFENQKVVRNVREFILNGNETWSKLNMAFQTTSETTPNIGNRQIGGVSSHFVHKYYANNITTNIQNGEFGWNAQKHLTIRNDTVSTAEDFKTWLSTNNTKIDYILDTPTEESIDLPNISTIKGTTIIDVDTETTPSNMWVKYKGK